jgi:hypothetical protein
MRSRAVRLLLTLLAIGGIGFASYVLLVNERKTIAAVYAGRDLDALVASASRHTLELRAAQQAYVATSQDPQFWSAKTTEIVSLLRQTFAAIRSGTTAAESATVLDEAEKILQQFERLDRRAREYAVNEQDLLASDLIFSDGLGNTLRLLTALDQLQLGEWNRRAAMHAIARRERLKYAAAAAGAALLIILILLPVPAATREGSSSIAPASVVPDSRRDLDLRTPSRIDRAPAPSSTAPAPAVTRPQQGARAPVPQSAAGLPDFETVAQVCSELARVTDTASLPAILQRAADALDATGIVLWVVDPDGKELSPIVSHGYPANLLSRMGRIASDADNVTAAAFRTGLLQTVSGDDKSSGAIAAPLVNPGGCIGVMSAELRNQGEKQSLRRAVAAIVAAQLATLVAPPAAHDNRSAAL